MVSRPLRTRTRSSMPSSPSSGLWSSESHLRDVKAHAVVPDADVEVGVAPLQRDADVARPRVAHRIGHRFRHNAIAGDGQVGRQPRELFLTATSAVQPARSAWWDRYHRIAETSRDRLGGTGDKSRERSERAHDPVDHGEAVFERGVSGGCGPATLKVVEFILTAVSACPISSCKSRAS